MTPYELPFVPQPGDTFDWAAMKGAYPWLRLLEETAQDPLHHAEGNAGIHTRSVLESLILSNEWQDLQAGDRGVLFWAALLHDVAKPVCTRIDAEGRITAPRHAVKGERMAREIMFRGVPQPVPFNLRDKIAGLVRLHGLPLWLTEQPDPLKTLIRASQSSNLKHLALLSEADIRGRICGDVGDLLDRNQLFREYSQEVGCYENPYPFETDLARYAYLSRGGTVPEYTPYDASWGEVILMSGLPAAGKDHWIAANAGHLPVVSLDDLRSGMGIGLQQNQGRVVQAAKAQARQWLRIKQSFVWNATNITRHIRKPLIDLFVSYGAAVKIVYVEAAYDLLFERNKKRDRIVQEDVIHRFLRKLDVPSRGEAHKITYCV